MMPTSLRRRLGDAVCLLLLRMRRKGRAFAEGCQYAMVQTTKMTNFYVVSCERNAGEAVLKCLDSVYRQKHGRKHVRHLFIDDASTDTTHELIRSWLLKHPDHNVEYWHNTERLGGTANTLRGFRSAPADSVVVELNGDDWFPDTRVLSYLNKVYASREVWMTYNTLRYLGSVPALWARKIPPEVIRANSVRDQDEWITSALHSFRKRLFEHLDEDTFIDPHTGKYWESADDQAIYLGMLELAGFHARHLDRITYVYNVRDVSHVISEGTASQKRALRVRQGRRYQPLDLL